MCGARLVSSRVGLWFVPLLQVLSFQSLLLLAVLHQLSVLLCASGDPVRRALLLALYRPLQPPSVAQATQAQPPGAAANSVSVVCVYWFPSVSWVERRARLPDQKNQALLPSWEPQAD